MSEPTPPRRPIQTMTVVTHRTLACRGCGRRGAVAPVVDQWVCPDCRRIEEPPAARGVGMGE